MGRSLPPEDHVARHCAKKFLYDDGSISPSSFELRKDGHGEIAEEYLSVGWLECYSRGNRDAQLKVLRGVMHPRIRKFHKKDKIAVLNVAHTIVSIREKSGDGRVLRFTHEPVAETEKKDSCHAGIHGTAKNEARIMELLVECVREGPYPAIP